MIIDIKMSGTDLDSLMEVLMMSVIKERSRARKPERGWQTVMLPGPNGNGGDGVEDFLRSHEE